MPPADYPTEVNALSVHAARLFRWRCRRPAAMLCANEILFPFSTAKPMTGQPVVGNNVRRLAVRTREQRTVGGYTAGGARRIRRPAKKQNLAADVRRHPAGRNTAGRWLHPRSFTNERPFIGTLVGTRYDTWVVSASPEPIVKV